MHCPDCRGTDLRQLLVAECYERRSLGITSNLVFSEWERIFANPMATAAAIDPVVHHSVILEFNVPSYCHSVIPPTLPSNGARPKGDEPAKLIDAKPARILYAGQRSTLELSRLAK